MWLHTVNRKAVKKQTDMLSSSFHANHSQLQTVQPFHANHGTAIPRQSRYSHSTPITVQPLTAITVQPFHGNHSTATHGNHSTAIPRQSQYSHSRQSQYSHSTAITVQPFHANHSQLHVQTVQLFHSNHFQLEPSLLNKHPWPHKPRSAC